MTSFSIISLELGLVVLVILAYTRLRKNTIFSLEMVKDLTIYMPPNQEDFDVLLDSIKPDPKGKGKKRFEKKTNKQAKFPMRQMPMGTELLQYCNQFFPDFDFILMLFHYCVAMFFLFTVMKIFVPSDLTQTNLTFYMVLICLLLVFANLRKGAFPAGLTRLTDETKVQLLFAFKSFIIVWCAFVYSEGAVENFMGLQVADHHELFVKRLNQVFALAGNKVAIPTEFTYCVYALAAGGLSFLCVKQNINYAFYFFVMTRAAGKDGTNRYLESRSEGHRFSFG